MNRILDIQNYYKDIFKTIGFDGSDIHFAGNSNKIKYDDLKGRPSICFFIESETYLSNPNDTIRIIALKIEIYEIPSKIYDKIDEFLTKFKRLFELINPITKEVQKLGIINAELKKTKYDMMKESLAKSTMLILLSYEIPQEV
jgi:hypothetical protein